MEKFEHLNYPQLCAYLAHVKRDNMDAEKKAKLIAEIIQELKER